MIAGFKDSDAKEIFERSQSRRYGVLARTILRKLLAIDAAITLEKLKSPPGNHLEALKADRAGQHNIRVNDQYRICFAWREDQAYDVEITDHH